MFEDSRRCVSCGVRELLLIVYVVKMREAGGRVSEGGIGEEVRGMMELSDAGG